MDSRTANQTISASAAGVFWILCCATLGLPKIAAAAAGRTAGTFAVTPSGAATYTIPIWAPRGPHGIQPHIALVYSSQSGYGYLGVGWNLAGLSTISRCDRTYAQDGAPAAISLSTNDGYCLNGQRLRLTGGTYGQAGSTYETEVANFENVTAHGTAGNGPAYFTVKAPNGVTYEYGNNNDGANSQVLASATALEWMLDKVTDPAGNTMTIAYCPANAAQGSNCPSSGLQGTTVPATISWTPTSHGASAYSYTMEFTYGTSVHPPAGYVAGTPITNPYLLASITVNYGSSQVREYVLHYQQSGTTSRDLLTQVQECSTSNSDCLAPTTVSYQSGSAGVATTTTTAISTPIPESTWSTYTPAGQPIYAFSAHHDFNGDGYQDIVYQTTWGGEWYIKFGSASGYGGAIDTGISGAMGATVLFGDLLGTSKDGILAVNGGTWYYYTWNGGSFSGQSTGLAYDSSAHSVALADINGDGLPDLVTLYFSRPTATIETRLNTSSNGAPSFSSSVVTAFSESTDPYVGYPISDATLISADREYGSLRAFDFNGDGRNDLKFSGKVAQQICVSYPYPYCTNVDYVFSVPLISQAGGTFTSPNYGAETSPIAVGNAANMNDDRCTDSVSAQTVYVAGCNGGIATTLSAAHTIIGTMDWNGNGLTDLLEGSSDGLYVQLSTGSGYGPANSYYVPFYTTCTVITIDANGDGLDDLGCLDSTSGQAGFVYTLHNGAGVQPDLVTSITDGYGNVVKPTYASMENAESQGHYTVGTDASYPYRNWIGSTNVVESATFSDPSNPPNATYSKNYYYANEWKNLRGRGLMGMGTFQVEDSRNSLYHSYYFNRSFPTAGLLTQEIVSNSNLNDRVSDVTNTLSTITLNSASNNERYFPYVSTSARTFYQVTGNTLGGGAIKTDTTNYSYNDYGDPTSIVTTRTDEDSGSSYDGDTWTKSISNTFQPNTSTWCLDLKTEQQVVYTATIGTSVTRTKDFTPDTTACHYTQIVTAPSSPTYEVTEALGYDNFGNVDSDTITGINMSPRTTTMSWGTTGQFPVSTQNAAGEQTLFGYRYDLGFLSSVTDPNNLKTSYSPDSFGREQKETRPDGTSTTWSYNSCSNEGGCLLGANTLAVTRTVYDADGTTVLTDGTTYYDELGRPFLAKQRALASGTYNRVELRYDPLGRITTRYFPCTWSGVSTVCPYSRTTTYDLINRPMTKTRPYSASDSTILTTTYAYSGDTTTVTDPKGNTRTFITDPNGWLRQTEDAGGYSITLDYDAAGSKTCVFESSANQINCPPQPLWSGTYAYGLKPYLMAVSDADRGNWNYAVDALGERVAWTNAKGQSFSETYDALSRPETRSAPDFFTQWTWGSSATADNIGKLESVCVGTGVNPTSCTSNGNSGYSESLTYDGDGRLYQRAIAIPGDSTYTYTWQYDSSTGLLSTMTYPTDPSGYALKLQYGYENGLLSKVQDISDSANVVTLWTADAEDARGQVTQATLGNGVVVDDAYDAVTGWLNGITAGKGGGTGLENYGYMYDKAGNVSQRQDDDQTLTENFYYDGDNRLYKATLNGNQNLATSYAANGNIDTYESNGAPTETYSYTGQQSGCSYYSYAQPHAVRSIAISGGSTERICYDANGNVTLRGLPGGSSIGIGWTSFNQPKNYQGSDGNGGNEWGNFSYGPDYQRWKYVAGDSNPSGSNQVTTTYIGKDMEEVQNSVGTTFRNYVHVGREVIVDNRSASGGGSLYYLLTDRIGSVAKVTDSSGNLVVQENYDAWGGPRGDNWIGQPTVAEQSTALGITAHGFTFQEFMPDFEDFDDFNGRVYAYGSFLSADPYIEDPSNPQNYNRYSYVLNNPPTYTDPTGFDCVHPTNSDPCQSVDVTSTYDGPPLEEVTVLIYPDEGALAGYQSSFNCHTLTCAAGKFGAASQGMTPIGGVLNLEGAHTSLWAPLQSLEANTESEISSAKASSPPQSKPCGGGGTSISNEWAAGADAGVTATDISLQGAGRLTENIQAPPDVNLGAIGVLGHAVTAFGLAISGYQAIFGSTAQAREQGAQDTAVNAFGARFPAAAPFTTIPYDIGRLAREIYDAWQSAQAEKIFQEAAQCTYSK